MSVDLSEFDKLARDLERAPDKVIADVHVTTQKAALNIKNAQIAATDNITPRGYAKQFRRSISYDVTQPTPDRVEAEIGPDKDRQGAQGALGNLLAFGSRNNAPVWDLTAGLEDEGFVYERFVGKAATDALS